MAAETQTTREARDGQPGPRQAPTGAIPFWAWMLVIVMAASMLIIVLTAGPRP